MEKANYKRLGDYIKKVNVRNKENLNIPLMGLSIQKCFIPSIANTIGTNMTRYKIIERDQFAYGPVTSRNGDKITIALFDDYDKALISQAYIPFKIKDKEKLLPKYLMMWFSRPEFDRYARFKSHGSARETFDWEEMCEVELPIPPIEKQREIVADYQAVENKIKTNEAICEKLEETAQTIYRRWFEENDSLKYINVKDFCVEMKSGGTPRRTKNEYWDKKEIPWLKTGEIKNNILIEAEEYISQKGLEKSSAKLLPVGTVLMSMYGVNAGDLGILRFEATTNQACCGMICKNAEQAAFLYYHLLHNQNYIASQAIGGAQQNLSKNYIENIEIPYPDNDIDLKELKIIIDNKELYTRENQKLHQLQSLLLGRMTKE